MIINVDSNREKYLDLFTKSYHLIYTDAAPDARFSSLEDFFANLATIRSKDPSYVMRMPVDEPTLAIDANKRTIDATLFNKCTNVQSDQMAEIVVFSIDRYFDYKDLADPNMQIWVQWTAPDGKGGTIEKATEITLRDTDTEPGKLRFGWPLDNVVTANAGKIQFAVRIFEKGLVPEQNKDGQIVDVEKVVYSFNTLPATLTIQKALQPELNDDIDVNRPNGLFDIIVRNSLYAGPDVTLPQTPSFDPPGLQLPAEATLDENDTLTLLAQAVVGDTSTINYVWYHTPVGATAPIACTDENGNAVYGSVGIAYRQAQGTKVISSDDYYSSESVLVDSEGRKDIYYSHIEGADMPAFYQFSGTPVTKELDDGSVILVDDQDRPLYEKYTTFTVPATGEVTGKYYVKATATKTVSDTDYTGGFRDSRECVLVSPSDIIITKELAELAVIEGDPAAAALAIGVAQTAGDNTIFAYDWQRYDNKSDTLPESNPGSATFNATVPGWYKVYVTADLNRQTNEYTSEWCKVTNVPAAPVLTVGENTSPVGQLDPDDASVYVMTAATGAEVKLHVDASVTGATNYDAEDLYSEGLTYHWVMSGPDTTREMTSSDIIGGSVTGAEITIQAPATLHTYSCTVTNTLNQRVATATFGFQVQ